MSERAVNVLIDDIGEALRKIERYTAYLHKDAFLADE